GFGHDSLPNASPDHFGTAMPTVASSSLNVLISKGARRNRIASFPATSSRPGSSIKLHSSIDFNGVENVISALGTDSPVASYTRRMIPPPLPGLSADTTMSGLDTFKNPQRLGSLPGWAAT